MWTMRKFFLIFSTVCVLSEIFVNLRVVGDANPYNCTSQIMLVWDDLRASRCSKILQSSVPGRRAIINHPFLYSG